MNNICAVILAHVLCKSEKINVIFKSNSFCIIIFQMILFTCLILNHHNIIYMSQLSSTLV